MDSSLPRASVGVLVRVVRRSEVLATKNAIITPWKWFFTDSEGVGSVADAVPLQHDGTHLSLRLAVGNPLNHVVVCGMFLDRLSTVL